MLYGRVLRAPSYGATLTSLDLAAAQKMRGREGHARRRLRGMRRAHHVAARQALEAIAATAQWKTVEQPRPATTCSNT